MKKVLLILLLLPFAGAAQTNSKEEVFTIVEQMPAFPGGASAMNKFILNNVQSALYESYHGISGAVYLTFVVGSDGSISDVKVLKGVPRGPGLESAAIDVVHKMPKWEPGKQNGKAVSVQYNLPIKFTKGMGKLADTRDQADIDKFRSSYQAYNEAYESKDKAKYEHAITKLTAAIAETNDHNLSVYRGLAYKFLGNKKAACEDFSEARIDIELPKEAEDYCK